MLFKLKISEIISSLTLVKSFELNEIPMVHQLLFGVPVQVPHIGHTHGRGTGTVFRLD
jgi:hypothetical protein